MFVQVLDGGRLVEFDRPSVLLSNSDSYFSRMVEQTGPTEAEYLRVLANAKQAFRYRIEQFSPINDETIGDEFKETDTLIPDPKSL